MLFCNGSHVHVYSVFPESSSSFKLTGCDAKVGAWGPGRGHVTVALLINTSALLCHINTIFMRQKPRPLLAP